MVYCRDDHSDTSSISQTSYEPAKPMFAGMSSEIPDSVATTTSNEDTGVMLISSKPRADAGMY